MLHENMHINRFMVHAQKFEEIRVKRKNTDVKRARSYEGGNSKGKLEIQDKRKFKKRFYDQVPTKFPKNNKDRVFNPKTQGGRSGNSPSAKPTCTKCGKKHIGECLV